MTSKSTTQADFSDKVFRDADKNVVEYDGSGLSWRVSAYGVIVRDGQVLLSKSNRELLWDVQGGGLELNESFNQAIEREALEEAGARVSVGQLITVVEDYFYHRELKQFYHTVQLFFRAQLVGELTVPTDEGVEKVEWVPWEKLPTWPLPAAVETALEVLRQQTL